MISGQDAFSSLSLTPVEFNSYKRLEISYARCTVTPKPFEDRNMNEKTAAKDADKIDPLHLLAERQSDEASNQLFDDYSQSIRGLFKGGLVACERVHDASSAFFSHILGEKAAENHTSALEKDAIMALKRGNLDAAEHYLDRNLRYTLWTQGLGDQDSRRVLMEYQMISKANDREHKEAEECAKHKTKGLLSVREDEDPAVQMAALIVNRYRLQKARI